MHKGKATQWGERTVEGNITIIPDKVFDSFK
jgi:hypothetical protein